MSPGKNGAIKTSLEVPLQIPTAGARIVDTCAFRSPGPMASMLHPATRAGKSLKPPDSLSSDSCSAEHFVRAMHWSLSRAAHANRNTQSRSARAPARVRLSRRRSRASSMIVNEQRGSDDWHQMLKLRCRRGYDRSYHQRLDCSFP